MKRLAFFVLLFLISGSVLANPTPMSGFIAMRRSAFADSYAQRTDKGFAKEFGYGTGIYVNSDKEVTVKMPFEWFAWCGTDGLIILQLNIVVEYKDRYKIMVETDQETDHPWDAVSDGMETSLSLDNKWVDCTTKKNCDHRSILDNYVRKIMEFSFFTEMKTAAYL